MLMAATPNAEEAHRQLADRLHGVGVQRMAGRWRCTTSSATGWDAGARDCPTAALTIAVPLAKQRRRLIDATTGWSSPSVQPPTVFQKVFGPGSVTFWCRRQEITMRPA